MKYEIETDVDFAKLGVRPVAYRRPRRGEQWLESLTLCQRVHTAGLDFRRLCCLIVEPIPQPWKPMSWLPRVGTLEVTNGSRGYAPDYWWVNFGRGERLSVIALAAAYDPDNNEPFVPPTPETYSGDWRCVDLSQFRKEQP